MLPSIVRVPRKVWDEISSCIYANGISLSISPRSLGKCVNCLFVDKDDLALLLINRQISSEAKTFFHSSHDFTDQPAYLCYFPRGIGDCRNHTKRIVIEDGNPDIMTADDVARNPQLFATLATMANMQVIKIYKYEKHLKGILERLGEWGLECLHHGAEMTMQNVHVRGQNVNHTTKTNGRLNIVYGNTREETRNGRGNDLQQKTLRIHDGNSILRE